MYDGKNYECYRQHDGFLFIPQDRKGPSYKLTEILNKGFICNSTSASMVNVDPKTLEEPKKAKERETAFISFIERIRANTKRL